MGIHLLYISFNPHIIVIYQNGGGKVITEKERQNMMHFLVMYFGVGPIQLINISDRMLEATYDFAYRRKEMECDF